MCSSGTGCFKGLNLISAGANTSGNLLSARPLLAGNGSALIFQSAAPDLVTGDLGVPFDIFLARPVLRDSDGDALEDSWEMAHFGDLNRDGSGDFDADGVSDLDEFKAGTNPSDADSHLQFVEILGEGEQVTLKWNAFPGRSYRVQLTENLNGTWTSLQPPVTATSNIAAHMEPNPPSTPQRFYRILLLE